MGLLSYIHCTEGGHLVKASQMFSQIKLQVKEYFVYNSSVGHVLVKQF